MAKFKQFRKPFVLVAILLIVLALFIANRIRTNRNISEHEEAVETSLSNRFAGRTIDTEVLEDEKFKELKPIPKLERDGDIIDISQDELSRVKRRYSNPFKPFN
ncbi:MAG: hypothetical protein ABIG10_02540 [bacterium]